MGEEKLNYIGIIKSIFKPTLSKFFLFAIIFSIVMLLPIYPTQASVSTYTYSVDGDYVEPELISQHIEYSKESIVLVLMNDFEWFETDIVMGQERLISELIEYEYSADADMAIPIYLPLATLSYVIGCFAGALYSWSNKDDDSYERDVHLWKPVKES